MSGPNQPLSPDAALDAFLAGGGAERSAWRQAQAQANSPAGPPREIDAAVLAHAEAAVADQNRLRLMPSRVNAPQVLPRQRQRALWGLLASMILGAGLIFQLQTSPELRRQPAGQRADFQVTELAASAPTVAATELAASEPPAFNAASLPAQPENKATPARDFSPRTSPPQSAKAAALSPGGTAHAEAVADAAAAPETPEESFAPPAAESADAPHPQDASPPAPVPPPAPIAASAMQEAPAPALATPTLAARAPSSLRAREEKAEAQRQDDALSAARTVPATDVQGRSEASVAKSARSVLRKHQAAASEPEALTSDATPKRRMMLTEALEKERQAAVASEQSVWICAPMSRHTQEVVGGQQISVRLQWRCYGQLRRGPEAGWLPQVQLFIEQRLWMEDRSQWAAPPERNIRSLRYAQAVWPTWADDAGLSEAQTLLVSRQLQELAE